MWVRRRLAGDPAADFSGRGEVERVLHVASGMLGRHVERFEVVIVVFELRAFDDEKSEAREDGFDALTKNGQRMPMAYARAASGERHVHGALGTASCGPTLRRASSAGSRCPRGARWRAGRAAGVRPGGAVPSDFSRPETSPPFRDEVPIAHRTELGLG